MFAAVTGASSGIGRAIAKEFASHGYDLIIASGTETIEEAAREIRAGGTTVETVQVDLSTAQGVERFADAIRRNGRPLDVIALNVGVGVGGDFRDTDLQSELRLIDLNCRSTVHLAKLALQMMHGRAGRMLFTSSIAALGPGPFESVYAASKAFVYSFAEGIRNELKDSQITVTALMPGPTETSFFERAGMEDTKLGSEKKDDPEDVARQAYEALMAGKDHVIAGSLKTKIRAAVMGAIPDTAAAELHRKESEPGSAPPS